jgi:hypothetical protein
MYFDDEIIEDFARIIAAEKMGLIKDKKGKNLPYELWSQCIPDARNFLGMD